jgi:hypothetical protein
MDSTTTLTFERFAQEHGFQLRLGRWEFVYSEGHKRLTLPVEMLAEGDYLWQLSRSCIRAWDSPFHAERIDAVTAAQILERVQTFVELTGKKMQVL